MNQLKNKEQMWDAVNVVLKSIPMEMLLKLIVSVPNRMYAVIVAEGGNIRW
jgi:hypothetical protein